MDVHMKANSHAQFRTNETAGHNADNVDELRFLSQEEKDILNFFEQTIDSLEQSLEEDELRPQIQSLNNSAHVVDGAGYPGPHLQTNPKEQDIIDLVRPPKPDLVQTKDTTNTFTNPDFQSLIRHPESHFEIKPHNEQADPLPDYIPTTADNSHLYHPPGSIPTPVLIAQKIAENQAGGGAAGPSVLSAASLLRRRSSEFDKSTSSSNNRQGPPTSTKPARYPANISVILGNREQPNPSLANVNLEERRALMLANLSGTSHPLDPNQDQKDRNTPTRSVSFRDPTPEKSRMEALSKLGLTRNRAYSGGASLPSPNELLVGTQANATSLKNPDLPDSSTIKLSEPSIHTSTSSSPSYSLVSSVPKVTPQEPSIPSSIHSNTPSSPSYSLVSSVPKIIPVNTPQEPSIPSSNKSPLPTTPPLIPSTSRVQEPKPRSPLTSNNKTTEMPPPDVQKSIPPPNISQKDYFPFPPAPPPVETSPEFNSYGGKSIVMNPSASFKNDSPSSPVSPEARNPPPILATPTEFNSYGGKSKVMSPIPPPVARRDLPDILSSHIDKSQTPHHSSSESYGGKTRTVNPSGSAASGGPSEGVSRTLKPPAPLPAPRPQRHSSYQGPAAATPKSPQRALSPEQKRRSSLFRPLGITVHFSGKGATDEARREALRKLGLWKE